MSLLSQDVPVPEGGAAPQPDARRGSRGPVPVEVHNPTGKATVALVTGILGVLLAFFIPLIGVILSAVARLERRGRAQEHEQRPRDGRAMSSASSASWSPS